MDCAGPNLHVSTGRADKSSKMRAGVIRLVPVLGLLWGLLWATGTVGLAGQGTEADRLALRQRGVLAELRQLEVARQIAVEELRQADAAVDEAETQATALEFRVDRLERDRNAVRPAIGSRLVEMYKLGRGRYTRLLLSASDLRRFGQLTRTVAALAARDGERIRSYERQLAEVDSALEELARLEEALVARRAKAVQARVAADQAVLKQHALVREIDQRRDLNAQLTSELEEAQRRLESTLRSTVASNGSQVLPIGPFRGALPWPAIGEVQRRAPSAGAGIASRPGVDILAGEGTPVQAIYDGRVAYAGSFDGLGNLVIVDHGGQTFTLYGHLLEFEAAEGMAVVQGQVLGRVGSSPVGKSTLYFELRVGGRTVDPLQWLTRPQ
jgi:murein hydrolase activator